MAMPFSIDLRASLLKLFPDAFIRQLAKSTGAVKRLRNVDPVHLFWTLVLDFGSSVTQPRGVAPSLYLRERTVHRGEQLL